VEQAVLPNPCLEEEEEEVLIPDVTSNFTYVTVSGILEH
jgi:hypothetical protein